VSSDCRHCLDFSRTQLLRRAAAEAGRGLPTIEPGMPLPAGTGLSRRSFLARSAGLALAVYGAGSLGLRQFEEGIASAATGPAKTVLVSIFLEGGADGLSLLYPDGDPLYRKLRPKLALPAGAGPTFSADTRLRWHPALAPLAQLDGEAKVVTLPAVGYTHPDQSHFTSRHYWEVGATDQHLLTGWLGRTLDAVGTMDNPLQGLSLDGQLAPALASSRVPVAAIDGVSYNFWTSHVWGQVEERMLETLAHLGAASRSDPGLEAAGAVTLEAHRLRTQLLPFSGDKAVTSPVVYPTGDDAFPQRLAGLAALLAAGLPLRCVARSAPGGYDTHADQAGDLDKGLDLTARSLLAFQRDLEARGLADRVLVHVWTEFGRRAQENGSAGTDHGAAGVGFVVGSRAAGGMVGEFPGLASGLDDDGNVRATADYRGVYSSLLEQWLGVDAERVIPGARAFARPALVHS
jgi:uncharacterized protein (DUF1501 family)